MQFLPIVERELRVAARHARTWWRRVLTLLAALVIFIFTWMIAGSSMNLSAIGSDIFEGLIVFAFIYVALAGPLATSDCLSRERREGTLGLLFLTDLRSYDIIFGKIAASSLDLFLGLLSALPLLAMPLLVGGITLAQFAYVVLALANIMMLSLAIGVFTSSLLDGGRASFALTIAILLLLIVGLPFCGEEILKIPSRGRLAPYFYSVCPLWTMSLCMRPSMTIGANPDYWISMAGLQILAWGLLVYSCHRTHAYWREVPESKFAKWLHERLKRIRDRNTGARLAWRSERLNENPVAWLEDRNTLQGRILVFVLAACAIFLSFHRLRAPASWPGSDWVFLWPLWTHYLLCLWIAIQAPRRLADDKQSGALELLLCTSLPVRQVVRGLMSVLWRRFGGAMLTLGILDAFVVFAYVNTHRSLSGNDLGLLCFWATLVLPIQGYAFARVGLYQGLVKGHSLKATFNIVFTIGVLPLALFVAWIIIIETCRRSIPGFPRFDSAFLWTSWALAHLTVFSVFLLRASLKLSREFRALAAASGVPWWRRWWMLRRKQP